MERKVVDSLPVQRIALDLLNYGSRQAVDIAILGQPNLSRYQHVPDRRAAYQGLVEGIREQRNPTGKDEFIAKKTIF